MTYQTRKWIQRFTLISMVLPLFLVAGFISAMLFMDFNQYKPQLQNLISEKSGYQAQINGNLAIGIWPFSLIAHEVELQNPEGFKAKNLLEIQALQVQLSLWALFVDKRLHLQTVEIEGAKIHLVTLPNGKSNWEGLQKVAQIKRDYPEMSDTNMALAASKAEFIHASVSPSQISVEVEPSLEPSNGVQSLVNVWMFDSLTLHNASVISQVYGDDDKLARQWTLSELDLMAFDVAPNWPFKSSLSFNFKSSEQLQAWSAEGLANVSVDAALKVWQLNDWSTNVRVSLPTQLQVPQMRLTSNGEALRLDFAEQRWVLQKGQLAMSPALMTFDMQGNWSQNASVSGHFKAQDLDIPKWLRHIGLAPLNFVNPQALTQVSGEFDFKSDATESSLRNLALNVDGATLVGQLWKVHDKQELGFDLDINELDMDLYQVAQTLEKQPVKRSKENAEISSKKLSSEAVSDKTQHLNTTYLPLALPIDTLRALNAKGQLTLGKLKIWQHRFTEVDVQIQANQGQIALAPLDAKLYEGQLRSKLQLDVSGQTPSYVWQGKVKNVQLAQWLEDGWQNTQVAGEYEGYFDLRTQGVNEQLLTQNLNGNFSAHIQKGSFKGIDLNQLLAGKASGPKDATSFERLVIDGKLKNGIYQLQKLNLNSERFTGSGFGQVDLIKAQVNAQINMTIVKPEVNLASLQGMQVPIQIKGPLNQVKWSVDLKGLLNNPSNQEKLLKEMSGLFK